MTEFAFETDRLRELFAATRVGAAIHSAAGAVSRSWTASSARRTWQRAAGTMNRMTPTERVRAIGIWAVAAAITDAMLTPFDPRPATIGRWALWGGVLLLGATAVVFAELVAAAWADWRARGSR
jgi:hypothetical protein